MKLHLLEVDTDLQIMRLGPLRFIHKVSNGMHATVEVRAMPEGQGALMGVLTMTNEEWGQAQSAAQQIGRLVTGYGRARVEPGDEVVTLSTGQTAEVRRTW